MDPNPAEPSPHAREVSASKRIKQDRFLAAVRILGNVTLAARAAQITRKTHYDWVHAQNGEVYAQEFAHAQADAVDHLLAEARRRAVQGVRRAVLYRGRQVQLPNPETGEPEPLWVHEFSDALLMLLLRMARPDKYGDGPRVEPAAPPKPAPPPFDPSRLTVEELEELHRLAAKASAAPPPAEPRTTTD